MKVRRGTKRRPKTARRIALCVMLAAPAALVYVGCSSSSNNGAGTVPPGGTFGEVVTVHVEGGGRIYSEPAGIDCPGSCTHSFIFDQGTEGAAAGVKLTAEGAAAWNFGGYTFNTVTVSSRGEGPGDCQPISRASAGAPPGADPSSTSVILPPAETQGTSAAEGGAVCSAYTRVPVAYDVSAQFTSTIPMTDSGLDSGGIDAGDAGLQDMLYDKPIGSTSPAGRRIFYVGGSLVWQVDDIGESTLYTGNTSGTFKQTAATSFSTITKIGATASGVAYQSSGTLYGLWSPFTSPVAFTGATTCNGVIADSSYAYCFGTDGSFTRWYRFSQTVAIPLDTNIFSVTSLDEDTSGGYMYYSDNQNISRISVTGVDGGMPAPDAGLVQIAQFQSTPREVHYSSDNTAVYWTEFGDQIMTASSLGGGSATTVGGFHSGLTMFAVDPFGTYIVAVASATTGVGQQILRINLPGGATSTVRTGLTGVGGIAVDTSDNAYWTDSSGRVFKASVF